MIQDVERYISISWEMQNMQRISGLSWVDVDRKRIGIGQFLDSKQYTELETALLQNYTDSSVVFMSSGTDYESQKVKQVLTRCNITATEIRPGVYSFHLSIKLSIPKLRIYFLSSTKTKRNI